MVPKKPTSLGRLQGCRFGPEFFRRQGPWFHQDLDPAWTGALYLNGPPKNFPLDHYILQDSTFPKTNNYGYQK